MALHVSVPLFEDIETSQRLGKAVLLKMDCYQPTGSFKIRGMGALCEQAAARGISKVVSSSGGNAGYSAAYAGRKLGLEVVVVVPSTTPATTREKLRSQGAEVIFHGDVWDEADLKAREIVETFGAAYASPFDDPILWRGHSSLVDEIVAQSSKPDAIVVSVGGGGLLCGVLEGLERNGWSDVKVVAVETGGAESLRRSIECGQLVTLPEITSIAKSLGARRVASEAFKWIGRHPIDSVVVPDEAAVRACVSFARSQRALVEPACGASLSIVYDNHESIRDAKVVVVEVCGGIGVTPEQIVEWQKGAPGLKTH